jgi:hypothetical protein
LNDRENAISNGDDVFIDLHSAKKNIEKFRKRSAAGKNQ